MSREWRQQIGTDERGTSGPRGSAPSRQSRHGPTIRDVAAVAGVSRGTVSRVLNGGRYVSPAALATVQKAIQETGYVANHSARSLARRRTDCIAFILSEPTEKLFEDPNFDVLLHSTAQIVGEHNRTLVLMIAGDSPGRDRVLRYTRGGHVDGVLLVSTHGGDPLLEQLPTGPIPVVSCGRPQANADLIPYVSCDNRAGGRQMTSHLLDQGRERVAIITGPLDTSSGLDRLRGYRDLMDEHGLPHRVASAHDYSYRSGEHAMEELLHTHPDLDAVFVASDLLAAGALATLRRHGRTTPDDVAVGGFDDSRIATTTEPPLTTIRQPADHMARVMTRLLVDLIEGKDAQPVVLTTELVHRDSA